MIGDPSMRSDERVMLTADIVDANSRNLVNSLKKVLDFDCPKVLTHTSTVFVIYRHQFYRHHSS